MEKLRHPNIVHFEEAFFDKTLSSMCIVMQYCDGGDLSEQIKRAKNVPFRETKILHWFVQIGLGLHHMHMRKIMHRDLKVFIYAHIEC
jgi:NIMA (never in mitosis gene a)-related kinase